jgi:hypothetical protein
VWDFLESIHLDDQEGNGEDNIEMDYREMSVKGLLWGLLEDVNLDDREGDWRITLGWDIERKLLRVRGDCPWLRIMY